MFQGATILSLDAKGRVAIPTRYREDIDELCKGQLVVTVDQDRCLIIYPRPNWLRIQEHLISLPTRERSVRQMKRQMLGLAEDVEPDSAGRIRLTQAQRDFARLGKKVVLIGQGNKFEMWDEATWNGLGDEWVDEEDSPGSPSALDDFSW